MIINLYLCEALFFGRFPGICMNAVFITINPDALLIEQVSGF